MDETPIEPTSTNPTGSEASKKQSLTKSLTLVLVALVAGGWAAYTIRNELKPNAEMARLLRSSDVSDRLDAVRRLGMVEEPMYQTAVPMLLAVDSDSEDIVRVARVWSLCSLARMALKNDPKTAREAARGMVGALTDLSDEVRTAGGEAYVQVARVSKPDLCPLDASAVVPPLVGLLGDSSANVRKSARRALVALAPVFATAPPAALVDGLASWKLEDSRAQAATALGAYKLGAEATVKALTLALKDADPSVRSNAAGALRNFGVDAAPALPNLIALLADPFVPPPPPAPPQTPQGKAPRKAGGGQPSTEPAPTDPAIESARAIGQIVEAQTARGETAPLEILTSLANTLKSDRTGLSNAGRDALRRIGKGASAVIPTLIQDLAGSLADPASGTGATLAGTLGDIAPATAKAPDAIAALVAALDAKSAETRSSAVAALGRFGTAASTAIPRLKELAEASADLAPAIKTTIDRLEGKIPPEAPRRNRAGGGGARRKAG
jgi:HEAT repeat protein